MREGGGGSDGLRMYGFLGGGSGFVLRALETFVVVWLCRAPQGELSDNVESLDF